MFPKCAISRTYLIIIQNHYIAIVTIAIIVAISNICFGKIKYFILIF